MVAVLFSVMAGCFGVIQSGLNKMISDHWGFSSALLLNGLVFLVFNFLLFSVVYFQPQIFPSEYRIQGAAADFKLWWILPGICGFMLVMGLAVSLAQVGAVQTFVICIAAQIVCSLLWDLLVEGKEIATIRLAGTAITFLGAFLATRS
jgi:bacterial/archaeal transporter family-2 protein